MRLSRMQHEINTLRSPIPEGGSTWLEDEIERLQTSCKQMVQQVEEAGPYGKSSSRCKCDTSFR